MKLSRVAINAAVVIATLLVAALLWQFHHAVVMFVISLAIAAAIRPLVEFLTVRRLPHGLALIAVYLMIAVVVVGVIVIISTPVLDEVQRGTDALARTYDQIYASWPKGSAIEQMIVRQLPAPADLYANFSADKQSSTLQTILGVTLTSVTLLSDIAAVVILSLYWSMDQVHFERLWLSLLPVESRTQYRNIWRDIEADFGAYIRSEVLQSLLAGVLLGAGYSLMGLPYPLLMAVFGALVWFIPWLGGVLAVIPVALVGAMVSPVMAIAAVVYTIAVLFFLEFYVEPRFTSRRQYSSILNILLILILAGPFGVLGLIVAPPLAAAMELILRYSLQGRATAAPDDEEVKRVVNLRERLGQVKEMAATATEPEPQTLNMIGRLEELVDKADKAMIEYKRNARRQRAKR